MCFWPDHPLFNKLCEKALVLLPKLGFKIYKSNNGCLSFILEGTLVVTIQHGGYDMPNVFFGSEANLKIIGFLHFFE